MPDPNEAAVDALRTAVSVAPENRQLANQLIKLLVDLLRYEEAEQAIRMALQHHPSNINLQLSLVDVYCRQGKDSHALAILETLVAAEEPEPRAMVMHARLLQRSGDIRAAVSTYREAIDADPDAADPEIESLLGIEDFREHKTSEQPEAATWQDEEDQQVEIEIERPDEGFQSVGGMETVKEEIRVKIIYPLQHADMYAAYGKKIGGGILLYGPPGCGKTHLARATAGEVKAKFMSIGINDVLDMWIANPLFNTFLRFHPFGQHLLDRRERWASNLIAPCLTLSLFGVATGLYFGKLVLAVLSGAYWVGMAIPIAAAFSMPTPQRRALVGGVAVLIGLIPIFGIMFTLIDDDSVWLYASITWFAYSLLAIQIASSFIAAKAVRH